MSHNCYRCGSFKTELGEMRGLLKTAVRQMENRPGTPQAEAAQKQVDYAKTRIEEVRERWDLHLAEVPDEPEKPRRILDVRRPKTKPEPKVKRVLIDADAMAQVLAETATLRPETGRGTNVLPATGHCHTCDKAVSGQRRFCGLCLAKRSV